MDGGGELLPLFDLVSEMERLIKNLQPLVADPSKSLEIRLEAARVIVLAAQYIA